MGWFLFLTFWFIVIMGVDAFLGGGVGALVGFLFWLILRRDSWKRVITRAACLGAVTSAVAHIGVVVVIGVSTGPPTPADLLLHGFKARLLAAAIVPILHSLVGLRKAKAS